MYVQLRDELGRVYDDASFSSLFPSRGQPAETPLAICYGHRAQFAVGPMTATEQQIELLLVTLEQHVTDISGIGPVLAASLVAEIGDINRFPRLERFGVGVARATSATEAHAGA
jgi:hypothetical protein